MNLEQILCTSEAYVEKEIPPEKHNLKAKKLVVSKYFYFYFFLVPL